MGSKSDKKSRDSCDSHDKRSRDKKDRRKRHDRHNRHDRPDQRVARATVFQEPACQTNCCNRRNLCDYTNNGNTGFGTCGNNCGTGNQSGWSWGEGYGSSSCCGCGITCGNGNQSGWSWM